MEEKYRHFLFGIVASVGLCFIILVFFTGDEVCINSKLLNISEWVLFGLICATVILGLLFLFFLIKANHETRDSKNTRWHIVTECSQDQELRSKRKLLFHPEVTVFPNSVISYCEAVEQVEFAGSDCYFMPGSFEGCANLKYIKLPHRLERIPDNMFKNCSSLKEIIIPSTVKSIGKNAFSGCSGLTSVVIPSSVTSIGDYVFYGCSRLTSVEIPAGVVDSGLFPAVTGECRVVVTGEITDSTVEKLRSMIDGMSAGAKIRLDLSQTTGLTSIGSEVFMGCSRLTSVTFGESSKLESIGSFVFYECSGLTSVEIPSSVTSIGERAFSGCSGLTSVYYQGDLDRWCAGFGDGNHDLMRYCENLYINGEIVQGDLVIPAGVTSIWEFAFKNCSGLSCVEIPSSVTSIGDYAFWGCKGLISVTFGEGSKLESIGRGAFKGCKRLTSVTFGDTSEWYVTESYVDAAKKAGGGKVVKPPFTKPTRNAKLVKAAFGWYWYKQK